MRGHFIVFEGIEGCGKSTQARLLAEQLGRARIPHRLTREPGGTRLGEVLRGLVLHGADVSVETELLLMLAARSAHVAEVVRPALEAGEVVVCDRYELSSFAYQGMGRRLGLDRVRSVNQMATGGLKPDLTMVVDVPLEVAAARRAEGRSGEDRIEGAGEEFHARVAEAYRLLASKEANVVLVDGTPAIDVVTAAIRQILLERFSEILFDLR